MTSGFYISDAHIIKPVYMESAHPRDSPGRRLKKERSQSAESDDEAAPARLTHTLTACCRCRQRKTKCDASLPKCVACERSGQVCEYWDPSKKQKIPRTYVLHLMSHVRSLEAQLNELIEQDGSPQDAESMIRPGGLTRLHENDKSPRYLGPSSGVAITRIVMEKAKKYTDQRNIRDLVPEARGRIPSPERTGPKERGPSYPMISECASQNLPSRQIAEVLMKVFNTKAQVLWPTLHEPSFASDLEDVYNNSEDVYKNFIVRMVFAIALQKNEMYAGLADSFYLYAIEKLEEIVKLKDIRTLQCLVLIAQYSLLTPTRTAIYYIVGLAARLCQQLGLTEEKTVGVGGVGLQVYNPLEVDMRRRLHWIVLSMEFGLAHSLGRPNAFATGKDHIDVRFFEPVDDENIRADGITPGPKSFKKAMAIHFFKMRLIQSEIRRVLYQTKRETPKNADDPWFSTMQKAMDDWHQDCPRFSEEAEKFQPWFTDRYSTIQVFLHRPSPQIPEPYAWQAKICYEASAKVLHLQSLGIEEVTWVFVITTHMALNTILWSLSYPEVRAAHPREEAEKEINKGIRVLAKSRERWPVHAAATDHYSTLSKAIFQSYDRAPSASHSSPLLATSPTSSLDVSSPYSDHSGTTAGSAKFSYTNTSPEVPQRPIFTRDVFGTPRRKSDEPVSPKRYFKHSSPTSMPRNDYMPMQHNSFRSSSIFAKPGTTEADRRPSSFSPDDPQQVSNWAQMDLPPIPPQEALRKPTNLGQSCFQVQSAPPNQQTFPTHVTSRDMNPFPANTMPRTQANNPLPAYPTPLAQRPLPEASFDMQVPRSIYDSPATEPGQIFAGTSHFFDWNPFAQDYEMHDRMGSLSVEQQSELMQHLEVDGFDFFHNMNMDSGLPALQPCDTQGLDVGMGMGLGAGPAGMRNGFP